MFTAVSLKAPEGALKELTVRCSVLEEATVILLKVSLEVITLREAERVLAESLMPDKYCTASLFM